MALGPRLDLRQSQSLVMTPQLQQAIKLLALSNLEIEAFIGQELENNPLLKAGEVSREADSNEPGDDIPRDEMTADVLIGQGQGEAEAPTDLDVHALDRDYDTGDAEWGSAHISGGTGDDSLGIEERNSAELSLEEHLQQQIGAYCDDPKTEFIARHIIGLLDDAGYLSFSLGEVAGDLGVTLADAEEALARVQRLEPTGVGARSLSECLAIQAREADRYDPCMQRLIENLDLLARGELPRLKRMCDVDDEDFADMLSELRSYDPKPGLAHGSSNACAVVPDVLISAKEAGGWDIKLNEDTLPRLIVNRGYMLELQQGAGANKDAERWLNEKLADANWLIKALDQRQKTILKTAAEIVKRQEGFFLRGVSELKPLTLKMVADEIDMHESTVSRVTSNKFLSCERGTFELKYFFTSGVASSDGEGASSEAVKARIKALIDAEDPKKILSDDTLVTMLKAEGFDLARRTVAKYREAMGIGSSVQRRRQKKLAGL
ncbi:RNA polymerase factor sigma-54 [Altererythrobacter sp.]|uniref:RNA polymerase factor sigma-54 n=1 Tax=Altererythrobacter sp. TaxID=1872480 RepID=UPI001B204D50|nr:RNA polymerase factor sigma-54 [Altererythrobacter sp.]MBO6608466.1 RNA polymerase factor sigma-54 [Altererythrobacter sp.]